MHVVWFAEIKWDYLRTRKQQLIRRRPRGVEVVFLEPFARGRENRYRLRSDDGVRVATIPFLKSVPAGPVRAMLDAAPVRRVVDAAAARRVRRRLRDARVRPAEAVFIVSNVFAIRIAAALRPARLVYDCNDAHADFPGVPAWTRDYQRECFRRADAVVVSSRRLWDDAVAARGSETGVRRIGNGVDLGVFRQNAGTWSRRGDGPLRLGYVGAVGPWFDFALVEAVARARSDWEVTIVGPVLPGVADGVTRLASLPNVKLLPAVTHEEVPRILAGFGVGVIPFRLTALTAAVNPNKLYEYLATGLPTVATPFSPDVVAEAGVVMLAADPVAFVAACESMAVTRRDPGARERVSRRAIEIASRHDWDAIAVDFWQWVLGTPARAGGADGGNRRQDPRSRKKHEQENA